MNDKDFVKALRKRLRWNTTRLAEFCRVKKGTVEHWEAGNRTPSKSAMKLMENVDKLGDLDCTRCSYYIQDKH